MAMIIGDRVQIQQVLLNLVLNAMDAVADTPEPRRTVRVSVVKSDQRVMLTVRDHGRGIAANDLPKLFDSFYSTKRAGMGLGLSIARTIVEAHGGHISVESLIGDGAKFQVDFPAIESTAQRLHTVDAL
jgi:signal transduction histidine kinase